MLWVGGLLIGSALFVGFKSRQRRKRLATAAAKLSSSDLNKNNLAIATEEISDDKNFPIATAALGFIVAGRFLFAPLSLLGVGGLVYLIWPTWKQAYYDITRKKRFTRMALESLALPATILTGHFMAAGLAYWFWYFALNNVAKAKGKTRQNLTRIFTIPSNQAVFVVREGAEIELTMKEIQIGDIVVLGAGEIIPVDGVIVNGYASIDQHSLTGESQPVEKQLGDTVFAATIVLSGHIQVKVKTAGTKTIASQTAQTLNAMTSFTDKLELRSIDSADRLALPYLVLGSVTSVFKGVKSGLAIFWAPLDDALYAAGPLSVLNYLNIALQRGILIKDGRALETLRRVDTIVFDKTGTLTSDIPQLINIHTCAEISETEVLYYAAAAEQKQIHPIALAILEAASARDMTLPAVQSMRYQTGFGLTVTLDTKTVRVGSYRFMRQLSLDLPAALQNIESELHERGYTLVYVAVNETIIGALELHTSLRPGARETVDKLQQLGYQVCIISGDHEKPTQHLAQQLGIEHYFAETLPQNKANIIQTMQQQGHVICYLGDGINDTIALQQANVSLSLRGASTVATNTAQIVLMNEELGQLIELLELAKKLESTYKNAILSSSIPSVGIIGGVFLFHLSLSAAIVAYTAGMGASLSQAMLPLLKERTGKQQTTQKVD